MLRGGHYIMPTYRYATECNCCRIERICSIAEMEEWELAIPLCSHGLLYTRDWSMRKSPSFREGWYEHLTEEPVYINSMQELKTVARDNGVYSQYAEELGGAFGSPKEGRWI